MGSRLDDILKHSFIESPVVINLDYTSDSLDIGNKENLFSIQLDYDLGSAVNMILSLETSVDGIGFVPLDGSSQVIIDDDGTHIWNVAELGTVYIRVVVTVTSGSINMTQLLYSAGRRH